MSRFTTRDFRRAEHNEFVKLLEATDPSGGRGFYKLFEDFLQLAALSLAQLTHRFTHCGKQDEKIEAEYMEKIGQYDRERCKHFAEALGLLQKTLESDVHDFLGDVFSATEISNKWAGQFFTPWEVCQLMSKITFGDIELSEKRITIGEPAVGGGAMLLSVAKDLREKGFGAQNWWFDATDVDVRCFHMAYVQLSLIDAPGVVRHANSISNEQWRAWITPAGAMFPFRMRTDEEPTVPVKSPSPISQKKVAEQLNLL